MTNLRWMKWAISRHFRQQGLQVRLASIRLGNTAIDGEVIGDGWKMGLELKTPRDDVTRGIGQLTEALAYGYDRAALVTTLHKTKDIDRVVFDKFGFLLFAIDSKAEVHQVTGNTSAESSRL